MFPPRFGAKKNLHKNEGATQERLLRVAVFFYFGKTKKNNDPLQQQDQSECSHANAIVLEEEAQQRKTQLKERKRGINPRP